MKRYKGYIILLLCVTVFLICLSACSKPAPEVEINEASMILIDAFANLTEGNYAEALSAFSGCEDNLESQKLVIEIGKGKAYFGIGDYQSAEDAFKIACGIDQDRIDLMQYLGEAQMQAGNYSAAVETFERLLEREHDNITALNKLEQSLRKSNDFNGLYKFFEARMTAISDGDMYEQNYYSGKLLEAARLTKDEGLILSTIDRLKDTPQGYAIKMGYEAYKLFSSGDEDGAKALLFNAETINSLIESAGKTGCYFGEISDSGNYQGRGLIIFGSDNRSSNYQIYMGEFADDKPNGAGTGYQGYASEYDDNDGKPMLQYGNNCVEADWTNGTPAGYVIKTNEYKTYSEGVFQWSNKNIETAVYTDGLAQGEVWSEHYYDNPNYEYGTSTSFTKHMVVDGIPVPFEVTVYGETFMAYEAYYGDSKTNAPQYAQEEPCAYCDFRF